jgi:hypothetical protein
MAERAAFNAKGLNIAHIVAPRLGNTDAYNVVNQIGWMQARGGADVSIYIPISGKVKKNASIDLQEEVPASRAPSGKARVFRVKPTFENLSFYLVENNPDSLPERESMLPWAILSQAAILHLSLHRKTPVDIIHCHGWETGLLPFSLRLTPNRNARTVFTPYDLNDLGLFPMEHACDVLGFPQDILGNPDLLEYYGNVSLLKGGFHADVALFPSIQRLDEALIDDPERRPGFAEFIKAVQAQGRVYGLSSEELDIQNGDMILRYAKDITQAYRLLHQAMKEGKGRGLSLHPLYGYLDREDAMRARTYFRNLPEPFAFIEKKFLRTVRGAVHGTLTSKIPANRIRHVATTDPKYYVSHEEIKKREEHYKRKGETLLAEGKLLIIDLAAGMATGYGGGVAKAGVKALYDVRYENERGISYLFLKRSNYLSHQLKSKSHILAAELVSNDSQDVVIKNLKDFVDEKGFELGKQIGLILIVPWASEEEIKELRKRFPGCRFVSDNEEELTGVRDGSESRWDNSIIVPLLKQPSSLLVNEDGRRVGDKYMSGHGDIYDVIKGQCKNIIKVFGIEDIFSSNTDNSGALISRSIYGFFAERAEEEGLQALAEVARKFEGDKGGVPALEQPEDIDADWRLTVLEEASVPPEMREAFYGRDVFPYICTNNIWSKAAPIIKDEAELPLIRSKTGKDGFMKVETVMAHRLAYLRWKAMITDREMRFLPAKFLTDPWATRTDWTFWYKNRLTQRVCWGEVVQQPLMVVSSSILSRIEDLDGVEGEVGRIFAHGHHDSMRELRTLVVGGTGDYFDNIGEDPKTDHFITECPVRYKGDVAVIYERRKGHSGGRLILKGTSERDEITFEDCVIVVPEGRTVTVRKKEDIEPYMYAPGGQKNPHLTREAFEAFVRNNTNRWTEAQRERVIEKFFPTEFSATSFSDFLEPAVWASLTATSRENAEALDVVFEPTGSFQRIVEIKGSIPFIKLDRETISGEAGRFASKAADRAMQASREKANIIRAGNRILIGSKGEKVIVSSPIVKDGIILALLSVIGNINENHPSEEKPKLLRGKLKRIIGLLKKRKINDEEMITRVFCELPWQILLETHSAELANKISRKMPA